MTVCGHPMPVAGEPCARGEGHRGQHRTADAMVRDSARHIRHYTADPAFREHRNAAKRVANITPEMKEARRWRDFRYRATTDGWATNRRNRLRGERERIHQELNDLYREEVECLRSLAIATQTK
jgi:hypothetical protein